MWKIKVYEEHVVYPAPVSPGETPNPVTKEDRLVHTMESSDKTVIAGFLRSVADSMDGTKKVYRDH